MCKTNIIKPSYEEHFTVYGVMIIIYILSISLGIDCELKYFVYADGIILNIF